MIRRNISIATIILALIFTLTACGGNQTEGNEQTQDNSQVSITKLEGPIAEQPVIITSAGQGADVEILKNLLNKAEIEFSYNNLLTAEELADEKTIVVAVGGSSKGLGAAGIKAEDELKRVVKLLEAAKEKNITVIAVHIGGKGRRGELSDSFINGVVPISDYIVVVSKGNEDGLFTQLAGKNSIPMDVVEGMADTIPALKKAFK